MATLDAVLLVVCCASLLLGAWRGLVYELFSLVGWVAAFWIARLFAGDVGAWLPVDGFDPTVRYAAGFVAVFVVAVFAWGLLSALAKKLIEVVGLRPVDRTLGALFGVLRGMVLVLVVTLVVVNTPLHQQDWWVQSWAGPQLADLARTLVPALPQELGRYLTAPV
ncbi:CvpA family protein [Comamonas sp. UBA7528]|uniref:CvpA family protein n=1 Tax=Comamonas sp. UBA7528 TaxID=1946391 RepID=UPI001B471875|nr:CvpA family protein [Comamonas sp. UBA7528]MBP7352973.1 CvpA family protein [Comamonas sp.]